MDSAVVDYIYEITLPSQWLGRNPERGLDGVREGEAAGSVSVEQDRESKDLGSYPNPFSELLDDHRQIILLL